MTTRRYQAHTHPATLVDNITTEWYAMHPGKEIFEREMEKEFERIQRLNRMTLDDITRQTLNTKAGPFRHIYHSTGINFYLVHSEVQDAVKKMYSKRYATSEQGTKVVSTWLGFAKAIEATCNCAQQDTTVSKNEES